MKSLIASTAPHHGLGNRVRVVLGAKQLAEYSQRRFYYVWPRSRAFAPRFDDLWQFGERTLPRVVPQLLSTRYPFRNQTLDWLTAASSEAVWQIKTSHALHLPDGCPAWHERLRALSPVDAVAERIDDFHHAHLAAEPYVGVMIRAHSSAHAKTVSASPVDWYLDRMRALRAEHPGLPFFVSCDVPEVQRRVQDAVGNCFSLTEKGVYNSVEGVQSAVVDLYLLAGSVHILGPHYSSFAELALHLSDPTVRLETAESNSLHWAELGIIRPSTNALRPSERGTGTSATSSHDR